MAEGWVSAYPNAGLPNAFGEYDEHADETGATTAGLRGKRVRQHSRRLLRHDAGPHRGRGGRGSGGAAAAAANR